MFEIVYDDDDGRTTDGRRLDGYPISSPCEPNGSGEIIKGDVMFSVTGSNDIFPCRKRCMYHMKSANLNRFWSSQTSIPKIATKKLTNKELISDVLLTDDHSFN